MASKFYYYPKLGGSLEVGAFNRLVTRCEQVDQPQRTDVYAGDQGAWVAFYGTRRRVRLVWEQISLLTSAGQADYRTAQALVAHLQSGGYTGFSADHTKTWVAAPGIGARVWSRGSTSLYTTANLLAGWASLASIGSGDQIAIESHPVIGRAEVRPVSSWTSSTRTLALNGEKLVYDYQDAEPLLRWYRCWPALRMPADALSQPPITNDRGITFSLDLILEVEPQIHRVTSPVEGGGALMAGLADETSRLPGARPTLESLLLRSDPAALRLRVR
jgi:hypothetical protein